MQELQGVIDNIVFQSEDNQFSVFRVKTDHEGKVSVVYRGPAPFLGESVELSGSWGEHAKFGRQFRAWICDEVLPTIRKYGFYVTPKVLAECDGNPEKLKRKLMEIQCYQFWNYCLDHPDKAADLISKFYEKAMKEDDIIDAEFCDEVSNETSRLIECSAVSNELRTARNAEISPV